MAAGGKVEQAEAANYTNINLNIKRFIDAVNLILPKFAQERREKRKAKGGTVDCSMISNLAGILGKEDGGVREGDMFSYARIQLSMFFNEQLPNLEWLSKQDLSECRVLVDQKYVYMLEVNLRRLEHFLDIKERSVQFQDRIR